MVGARFDRFARQLARSPHSRRAVLQAGGLGVIAGMLRQGGFDAPGLVNVPTASVGIPTNTWLGKSPIRSLFERFFAVFRDWHAP